jgi:fructose-bisphosphate aldolase class II
MIIILVKINNGDSFQPCKSCIEHGFCSVMIDRYVPVQGELAVLPGVEDDRDSESHTSARPEEVQDFVKKRGIHSLAIDFRTSHGADKFPMETKPP